MDLTRSPLRSRGGLQLLALLSLASCCVQDVVAFGMPPLDVTMKSFKHRKSRVGAKLSSSVTTEARTYRAQLPIDHADLSAGTFQNRWWMNDTYYDGGPVFLYDYGEADASGSVDYMFTEAEGPTALMQLAKAYKGLAVFWEHRYYGESQPHNISEEEPRTTQQWSYLTFEQALDDVVQFAKDFQAPENSPLAGKLNQTTALQPNQTPWIFLGGSYPGIRAATLRVRNPDVIFASWASSAPVQAQVEMPSYFQAIQRGLPKNCSADYIAVTKYVDDALSGSNETLAAQVKYDLAKARLMDQYGETEASASLTTEEAATYITGDVTGALIEPLYGFQSYGSFWVQQFCELAETHNGTVSPMDGGIAASAGVQEAYDAFLASVSFFDADGGYPNMSNLTFQGSWGYQFCTEFGYYHGTNVGNPDNIVSRFIDKDFFDQACRNSFPEGSIPSSGPAVDHINKYGGWKMNPTRTFFSNGEFDPWRTLGLASEESNAPKRTPNTTVPGCDAVYGEGSYFGVVYPGKVHVPDLDNIYAFEQYGLSNNDSFPQGLAMFKQALDQWLPCFKVNSSSPSPTTTIAGTTSPTAGGSSGAVDVGTGFVLTGSMLVFALLLIL